MTNSKELFNELVKGISLNIDIGEKRSIAYLLLEKKLSLSKTDVLSEKMIVSEPTYLSDILRRINQHEPVQYILGETTFYGRSFTVNPSVLIPRPETEVLVHEIIKHTNAANVKHILDIGTGSGCIATTLGLELPHTRVDAIDISEEAIRTAKANAERLGVEVNFKQVDILNEEMRSCYDLIVSNPPYIDVSEKKDMELNVLDYEPHIALFAPPENVLAFYHAIAEKSRNALNKSGEVWVEINERFGTEIGNIFLQNNFTFISLIKDLNGKNRFVRAQL